MHRETAASHPACRCRSPEFIKRAASAIAMMTRAPPVLPRRPVVADAGGARRNIRQTGSHAGFCTPAPQPRSPLSPTLAATTTQTAPAPPPRPEPDKTASTDTPPVEKTPVVNPPIEKPPVEKPPVETPPLAAKPATDARARRHQGFAAGSNPNPTRRSATGRPKARPGRFASSNAARRCAATSSISRQASRKTSGRTSKRTFGQASRAMPC